MTADAHDGATPPPASTDPVASAPTQQTADAHDGATPPSTSSDPAASAAAPVSDLLLLEPARINDPEVTGLTAYILLLPAHWTLDASVLWTPAVDAAFVNVSARATGPHGHEVTWLPDGSFTSAAPEGAVYGDISDGKVYFPVAPDPAEFIKQAVLPSFRPDIQKGMRVMKVSETPGLADAWERHHKTFLAAQQKHQTAVHQNQAPAGARVTTRTQVTAPRIRLGYSENGVAYEEDFTFIYLQQTSLAPGTDFEVHDWCVLSSTSLRAPVGELDAATPGLRAIADALTPTRRWDAAVEALTPRLVQADPPLSIPVLADEAQVLVADLADLVTAHARGWAAQQAARAARSEAFAQHPGLAIRQTADGAVRLLLPAAQKVRALRSSPGGAVVLTEDPASTDAARPGGPWETLD